MAKEEKKDQQAASGEQQEDVKQAAQSEQADQHEHHGKCHHRCQKLQKEIDDLKKQLADKDDKYLRAEAEIQNMTTRFNKERAQILKYDGQDLAKSVLPVLDNLKRALTIEVNDENGQQLKKGIQMVHDHLTKALEENGVTEIPAEGKIFDPTLHQAVQTVPVEGDQKPETVVKVLQAGYQLKDRVLRPAMVVVAQ